MKKLTAILLMVALLMTMAACGGKDKNDAIGDNILRSFFGRKLGHVVFTP